VGRLNKKNKVMWTRSTAVTENADHTPFV